MKAWETVKSELSRLWADLRAASTVGAGDAVLLAWASMLKQNADALSKAKKGLSQSYLVSTGYPENGLEAEEFAKGAWRLAGNIQQPLMLEYGWRKSFQDEYSTAETYWARRVASFAAAVSGEVATTAAGIAESVASVSEDVGLLSGALEVVSSYVEIPDDVRAQLNADLSKIRANRSAEVVKLRETVVRMESLSKIVAEGKIDEVETVEEKKGGVSPLVLAAGAGVLAFFILGRPNVR